MVQDVLPNNILELLSFNNIKVSVLTENLTQTSGLEISALTTRPRWLFIAVFYFSEKLHPNENAVQKPGYSTVNKLKTKYFYLFLFEIFILKDVEREIFFRYIEKRKPCYTAECFLWFGSVFYFVWFNILTYSP